MIDQGTATVVASICGLAGVAVTAYFADRRAARNLEREQATAAAKERADEAAARQAGTHEKFSENLELQRYVDGRIEAATKPLHDKIDELRDLFRDRIARIRDALRAYILEVQQKWPVGSRPPEIHPHLRELLIDDDLDSTRETAAVRLLADDIKRSNDHTGSRD